jgi:hypothetical protein
MPKDNAVKAVVVFKLGEDGEAQPGGVHLGNGSQMVGGSSDTEHSARLHSSASSSLCHHSRMIILTLEALSWYMPNDDLSIIIRLNFDSLRCQGKHGCLDRRHIVTTCHPFPPDDLVSWLQCYILRRSL